jgi:hypothetical protein
VQPEMHYARLGRDRIAYLTIGEGPLVLVNAPGSFSHADVVFEDTAAVLYYRRLASFCKVVHFDRRGTGGSDAAPSGARPPWELYIEELTAVLDAVGVERAAILAMFDVGPMAILLRPPHPNAPLPGHPLPRPDRPGQSQMGHAMEAGAERFRHHLRRPVPGRRDLLTQPPETPFVR